VAFADVVKVRDSAVNALVIAPLRRLTCNTYNRVIRCSFPRLDEALCRHAPRIETAFGL